MFDFKVFSERDREDIVNPRSNETRLGETIRLLEGRLASDHTEVKYVLLGIPESIGPQANLGRGGAEWGWAAFLSRFMNMQANQFVSGKEVLLAGAVSVEDLQSEMVLGDVPRLRELVAVLDDRVEAAIRSIGLAEDQTLIVVGGGHNNAYPIMKALGKGAAVVNVDPHADFRSLEGRHSGNGFRYAMEEGLLRSYIPAGLHQAYNSSELIQAMTVSDGVTPLWWEDHLGVEHLFATTQQVMKGEDGEYWGLEMDMDVIAQMPVSAYSPEGFSPTDARKWVKYWKEVVPFTRYFHLPEAAPTTEAEAVFAGKVLSYLVWDFVACQYKEGLQ